jgi:hypothetical protein
MKLPYTVQKQPPMSIPETVLFTLQRNMFSLLPLGGNNMDKDQQERAADETE